MKEVLESPESMGAGLAGAGAGRVHLSSREAGGTCHPRHHAARQAPRAGAALPVRAAGRGA